MGGEIWAGRRAGDEVELCHCAEGLAGSSYVGCAGCAAHQKGKWGVSLQGSGMESTKARTCLRFCKEWHSMNLHIYSTSIHLKEDWSPKFETSSCSQSSIQHHPATPPKQPCSTTLLQNPTSASSPPLPPQTHASQDLPRIEERRLLQTPNEKSFVSPIARRIQDINAIQKSSLIQQACSLLFSVWNLVRDDGDSRGLITRGVSCSRPPMDWDWSRDSILRDGRGVAG